jgi:hypothetical protein
MTQRQKRNIKRAAICVGVPVAFSVEMAAVAARYGVKITGSIMGGVKSLAGNFSGSNSPNIAGGMFEQAATKICTKTEGLATRARKAMIRNW